MLIMLFVGLSVPHFGVILSLVGGTTVTASNFIFPPLFYLLLSRQKIVEEGYGNPPESYVRKVSTAVADAFDIAEKSPEVARSEASSQSASQVSTIQNTWTIVHVPLHIKVVLIEIIFIGVVGGIASTYSVLASLIDGSSGFTVPCYVDWATADPQH